jgi:hypothetical protein
MAIFDVDVAGKTYAVDAADSNDAWAKANQMHASQSVQKVAPEDIFKSLNAQNTGGAGTQGFFMGMKDPLNAAAQLASRSVPASFNAALDYIPEKLRNSNIPIVAPFAQKYLQDPRPEAIDAEMRKTEQAYQQQRNQGGESGFDLPRMTGNVGPMMAAGVGALPAAAIKTLPRLLASSTAVGGASSQLTPAVTQEEQANFPETKANQAKYGMMLGPLGTIIGKGAGAVGSNIAQRFSESSAVDAAKQKLAELLAKSGRGTLFEEGGAGNPLSQIQAKLASRGPEATIAGAGGETTKSQLDMLATMPGQAKTLAEQFIRDQQSRRGVRLVNAADEALGTAGKPYTASIDALLEKRLIDSKPYYDQLKGLEVTIDPKLASILKASEKGHKDAEILAQVREQTAIDISKLKVGEKVPFDSLSVIKDALWDLQKKSKVDFQPTNLSNAYNDLRIKLNNHLIDISPRDKAGSIYKQANELYSGPSQFADAIELGRETMKMDPIKLANNMKGMTSGEVESFRIGVLQSLREKLGTESGQTSILKMWKEPGTSDKLKQAFGNDYRTFAADVAREARNKEIETVGRGSGTAARLAQMENEGLNNTLQGAQAVTSAVHGNPVAAVGPVARMINKASTTEAMRNELAKLLLQKGPAAQQTIKMLPSDIQFINEKMAKNAALANALAQQTQTPTR